MKRPPILMHFRFQGKHRGFGLWLPLFLLLPLALVVLIILSPLILIAILVLWPSGWGKRALFVLRTALDLFHSMHGLKIDIQSNDQYILLSVI